MATETSKQLTPVDRLKTVLNAQSVQDSFKNALKEGAALFTTSIIDLYNSDNNLQKCSPQEVVVECLKAATLKLPINKNLGFAYVIPYNKSKKVDGNWVKEAHPQFQLGYRGYIQLAMRTAAYRNLNNGAIYEGMKVEENFLTGEITITGHKESDTAIGYFAYMEMINGFKKALFWSKERLLAHAKRYSKSYDTRKEAFDEKSAWATNFDEMAQKTLIRYLISHYGIMSVEMIGALTSDNSDDKTPEQEVTAEISQNANDQTIDIESEPVTDEQEDEQPIAGPDY
ncbi:hypothetical protein SPSIL_014860 [Sporomusa silvacetica DSM 10669]|uniref:Recombination and repair protein RecT n=1 Tax=Sporomusa silvacetica DSM 10669 TaxID=1123289 RepID=A0ABZ3II83_9FIRM|nr:recombinase RecT [Sporomusa silvacetica]OZC21548.1 recombination and repair protein RecT [Sporomusa silvacetica DSM 10669]